MMPPPTPNAPERMPARKPTRSPRAICSGLIERKGRARYGLGPSREECRGALQDLALSLVGGGAERFLEREPAHLLHLEVVVVHVAARLTQEEEVHHLRDADALPDV